VSIQEKYSVTRRVSDGQRRMAREREAMMAIRALTIPVTLREMVCRYHGEIQIEPVLPS
jgi:hypothetical protein